MKVLFALLRALAVLVAVALLFVLVPAPCVSSSAIELVTEVRSGESRILPLEMARHLREAILDPKTISRLAAEGEHGGSDAERIDAAARVERAVEVVTLDGRVFHVAVRDQDAERATRVSNELAALAVARAPDVVARACREPGCTTKARVAEQASLVPVPMEPERWLALGFGLLIAFAVGVVPLTVSSSRERTARAEGDEDAAEEEKPPPTDRLPAAARPMAGTLPLDPPRPRAPSSGAVVGAAGGSVASTERARPDAPAAPVRAEAPIASQAAAPARAEAPIASQSAAPARAEAPIASPIMGYAAAPGWHADATLHPGRRSALAAELRAMSSEDCVALAVSGTPQQGHLKAALATEIALAVAGSEDRRLLFVEADFRNPGISALLHLEIPEATDFTSELGRRAEGSPSSSLGVLICTATLHVLPARLSASDDLILTTHFEACLRMMRDYYDLIIVHAPLTSAGVYCTAIGDVVDAVVIAGEEGAQVPVPFLRKSLVRVVPT